MIYFVILTNNNAREKTPNYIVLITNKNIINMFTPKYWLFLLTKANEIQEGR